MTFPFKFYPSINVATNITQAFNCVITLVLPVIYQVNEFITVNVPQGWGMTQINGMTGKVVAVNTGAGTITLDIDTSGFDPFVIPPVWTQLPQTVPNGELGITLNTAVRDNAPRTGYTPAP